MVAHTFPVQFYSSALSLTSLPEVDYIVNTRWITAVQSLSHLDKILTMQKNKTLILNKLPATDVAVALGEDKHPHPQQVFFLNSH